MPSVTSWLRLEPRNRDAEMNTSLQARTYDPLWMLTRQWQFGEFQGEDNGSPVIARWRGEAAPLSDIIPAPLFQTQLRRIMTVAVCHLKPSSSASPFVHQHRNPNDSGSRRKQASTFCGYSISSHCRPTRVLPTATPSFVNSHFNR